MPSNELSDRRRRRAPAAMLAREPSQTVRLPGGAAVRWSALVRCHVFHPSDCQLPSALYHCEIGVRQQLLLQLIREVNRYDERQLRGLPVLKQNLTGSICPIERAAHFVRGAAFCRVDDFDFYNEIGLDLLDELNLRQLLGGGLVER